MVDGVRRFTDKIFCETHVVDLYFTFFYADLKRIFHIFSFSSAPGPRGADSQ